MYPVESDRDAMIESALLNTAERLWLEKLASEPAPEPAPEPAGTAAAITPKPTAVESAYEPPHE